VEVVEGGHGKFLFHLVATIASLGICLVVLCVRVLALDLTEDLPRVMSPFGLLETQSIVNGVILVGPRDYSVPLSLELHVYLNPCIDELALVLIFRDKHQAVLSVQILLGACLPRLRVRIFDDLEFSSTLVVPGAAVIKYVQLCSPFLGIVKMIVQLQMFV